MPATAMVLYIYIYGGGGVTNRLSAYASIPCYLCVAVALAVSKVLT
jgi:hypothetical protein